MDIDLVVIWLEVTHGILKMVVRKKEKQSGKSKGKVVSRNRQLNETFQGEQ